MKIVLILTILASTLLAQDAPKNDTPKILFRIIPIAQPPRVSALTNGDNTRAKIIDEHAIPPANLWIHSSNKNQQPLTLALNCASRYHTASSTTLRITEGTPTEQTTPLTTITLPAEQGVFTILLTRRPGSKDWKNPIHLILKDPTAQSTTGLFRLVNFTPSTIAISAGKNRMPIKPLQSIKTKQAGTNWKNLTILQNTNNSWSKIRTIAGHTGQGIVQIAIVHQPHQNQKAKIITINTRTQDFNTLLSQTIETEKLAAEQRHQESVNNTP